MPAKLSQNSYGKSNVRLTKVIRHGERHDFMEMSVNVLLEGDFAESYTTGDNSKIVATDSMKNTVYVIAKENDFDSIEDFASLLANHFVRTYTQVASVKIEIEQGTWQRISVDGKPHDHAFQGGSLEKRTSTVHLSRDAEASVHGGVSNLVVLKTTASEFHTFVTDRYRTLKDTNDRIFATAVDASWKFIGASKLNFNAAHDSIRRALLETFATHHSLAVQQTLLAMGQAALDACAEIDSIELIMPNQHRIPFNLEPFGLKNNNDIFVPTDEPFGLISGTVTRK